MGQRQLPADRHQRVLGLVRAGQRDRSEQALGVGVAHVVEDLGHRALLHDDARVHHVDPVAGRQDQSQVVGDIDHRGVELAGKLRDQLDDAGLDGHVERGGRLVEQQQRRVGQERHGDHHALLLTARDLVRIGGHDPFRVRDVDVAQDLVRAVVGVLRADLLVVQRHLHQLLAQRHARVERGHGLLIDHGDLVAAQLPDLLLAERRQIGSLVNDLTADDAAVAPQVAHDAERHGRLAAAGFADQADALALMQGQVEVDHGRDFSGAREVGERKVPALEDGAVVVRAVGRHAGLLNRAARPRAGRRRAD